MAEELGLELSRETEVSLPVPPSTLEGEEDDFTLVRNKRRKINEPVTCSPSAAEPVNFKDVFHRLYNSFIDKYIQDVMFRLIYDILPVSYYMHNIGVYKNNKCIFRRVHVETKSHLFYECAFVKPLVNIVKNFLNIISDNRFPQFNILHIRFHNFQFVIVCKEKESVYVCF